MTPTRDLEGPEGVCTPQSHGNNVGIGRFVRQFRRHFASPNDLRTPQTFGGLSLSLNMSDSLLLSLAQKTLGERKKQGQQLKTGNPTPVVPESSPQQICAISPSPVDPSDRVTDWDETGIECMVPGVYDGYTPQGSMSSQDFNSNQTHSRRLGQLTDYQDLVARLLRLLGEEISKFEAACLETYHSQQDLVVERRLRHAMENECVELKQELASLRNSFEQANKRYADILRDMIEGSIIADHKVKSLATQCGAATAQSESRLPTPQGGPNGLESSSNQKPSTGDSEATTSPHVAMDDGLKRTLTAHYVLAQQLTDVQQERDHLKQTIQAVKRCVRCKQKYQFLENSEQSCRYHPGRIRYFSCVSCGGEKYLDCCNKCDRCIPGCRLGPHVAP
eukprot:GHVN01050880.1.p1 GENE.GHVN01050880.1~~GHVN01050880.1.p1  ORF type:complete len:406 (+),score=29.68 GHVN01050880.1:47-1219(+)